jgi:glutathione S-transferase
MHSGFPSVREHMSFNLCFLANPPAPPAEALAEAREMLALWEDAVSRKTEAGEFLFGPFCGADVLYAPAVVRLTSFRVPTEGFPRAATYLEAVMKHAAVRRWMDEARSLPPLASY